LPFFETTIHLCISAVFCTAEQSTADMFLVLPTPPIIEAIRRLPMTIRSNHEVWYIDNLICRIPRPNFKCIFLSDQRLLHSAAMSSTTFSKSSGFFYDLIHSYLFSFHPGLPLWWQVNILPKSPLDSTMLTITLNQKHLKHMMHNSMPSWISIRNATNILSNGKPIWIWLFLEGSCVDPNSCLIVSSCSRYPVAIFFRQCRGQLYTFLKPESNTKVKQYMPSHLWNTICPVQHFVSTKRSPNVDVLWQHYCKVVDLMRRRTVQLQRPNKDRLYIFGQPSSCFRALPKEYTQCCGRSTASSLYFDHIWFSLWI